MVDRWKPEGILGGMLQDNERGRYVSLDDHGAALKAKDEAYNELMQQAIRFAVRARDWGNDAVVEEAQAFLNRPDVQTWRKEQG